jgi:hypothetical protein
MEFEEIEVCGVFYLIGNPEEKLMKFPWINLNIDDKVTKIGRLTKNGKESSSCRVHKTEPYMTYKGQYWDNNNLMWLVFLLPELFKATQQPFYFMMCPLICPGEEPELLVPNYKDKTIAIYKAEFELYNEKPIVY